MPSERDKREERVELGVCDSCGEFWIDCPVDYCANCAGNTEEPKLRTAIFINQSELEKLAEDMEEAAEESIYEGRRDYGLGVKEAAKALRSLLEGD